MEVVRKSVAPNFPISHESKCPRLQHFPLDVGNKLTLKVWDILFVLGLQCCQECNFFFFNRAQGLSFLHIEMLYFLTDLCYNLASRSQCKKHARNIKETVNFLVSRSVSAVIVFLHDERHMVFINVMVILSTSL